MNPEPLPPEFRELEDRLARRPLPDPPAEFRTRLLAAASAQPTQTRPASRWRFVVRVAAAAVLLLNLGLSIANGARFQQLEALGASGPSFVRPESPDSDDGLETLAASAFMSLRPAPDVGALGRNYFSREEGQRWATP